MVNSIYVNKIYFKLKKKRKLNLLTTYYFRWNYFCTKTSKVFQNETILNDRIGLSTYNNRQNVNKRQLQSV